jgi:predicted TIM-barrel fold metal-dependent hydrolase
VISVDDHLVEPPHMFEQRLPQELQADAPRVIDRDDGSQAWLFDGVLYEQVGLNAVAGRPKEDWSLQSTSFDEIRRGCWDIDARIRDMDLAGVYASANFPSQITGFCGSVFARCSNPELGRAVTRAWNDWLHDEWWQPYPERSIPMGITWLADPVVGADEIRRNAARGYTAVTLPEQPHRIGMPSIFTGFWDPILEACQETETVVCLHVGSSGLAAMPAEAPQLELASTLFSSMSLTTCAEWLWSGVFTRFPNLKVVLAEGGIGWVPMLLDRLDYIADHSGTGSEAWSERDLRPSEVLARNFYFTILDDRSTLPIIERVGVDHVLFETDYPHADSLWPSVQDAIEALFAPLTAEQTAKITHANAATLFRHPLPESVVERVDHQRAEGRS